MPQPEYVGKTRTRHLRFYINGFLPVRPAKAYPEDTIQYFQSNVEGFLIDRLQQAQAEGIEGVALNAGAYTHTSIALADCISALGIPVVEVHISNVHRREPFRHQSMIAAACAGVICGFGMDSYRLAIEALKALTSGR